MFALSCEYTRHYWPSLREKCSSMLYYFFYCCLKSSIKKIKKTFYLFVSIMAFDIETQSVSKWMHLRLCLQFSSRWYVHFYWWNVCKIQWGDVACIYFFCIFSLTPVFSTISNFLNTQKAFFKASKRTNKNLWRKLVSMP